MNGSHPAPVDGAEASGLPKPACDQPDGTALTDQPAAQAPEATVAEPGTPVGAADSHTGPVLAPLDWQLGPLMFWCALFHLGLLAILLHMTRGDLGTWLARVLLGTGAVLHLAFFAELGFHIVAGSRLSRWHWWSALLPPLRMGARDHLAHQWLWLPGRGWQFADRHLETRLRKFFGIPLMFLAVLVLPMFIIELYWHEYLDQHPAWKAALDLLTSVIWFAFVVEFVLLISVARRKWSYALRNWIDLVVILLPLLAFLRSARLARLIRLNQVARTAQLYRVRGLLLRSWRALVALELVEKIIWRDKRTRIARLEEQLVEREAELESMRQRLAELRAELRKEEEQKSGPGQQNPGSSGGPR